MSDPVQKALETYKHIAGGGIVAQPEPTADPIAKAKYTRRTGTKGNYKYEYGASGGAVLGRTSSGKPVRADKHDVASFKEAHASFSSRDHFEAYEHHDDAADAHRDDLFQEIKPKAKDRDKAAIARHKAAIKYHDEMKQAHYNQSETERTGKGHKMGVAHVEEAADHHAGMQPKEAKKKITNDGPTGERGGSGRDGPDPSGGKWRYDQAIQSGDREKAITESMRTNPNWSDAEHADAVDRDIAGKSGSTADYHEASDVEGFEKKGHVQDFKAGHAAAHKVYSKNPRARLNADHGAEAYGKVQHKHGQLWKEGFNAATDHRRGAYATKNAKLATKLGLKGSGVKKALNADERAALIAKGMAGAGGLTGLSPQSEGPNVGSFAKAVDAARPKSPQGPPDFHSAGYDDRWNQ